MMKIKGAFMENITYETATKEINNIISKIEEGNLPISEAMEFFNRGKELIQFCYNELDGAKGKLTEIKDVLGKLEEI